MRKGTCQGFTLIELVVTLVIMGILGSLVGVALTQGVLAFRGSNEMADTLSKLRYATERTAREIRTVRLSPADPGHYSFLTRNTDKLSFQRLETDGTTVTTITIDGSSGSSVQFTDSNVSGSNTLTDQLNSLTFNYYQTDGTTAASAHPVNNDIAYVEIELVLADSSGNLYPQRTRVSLRNQQ